MTARFFVPTHNGVFSFAKKEAGWQTERVSFLGDAVSQALYEPRSGTLYAALGLGHFGVKLRRSRDLGDTWEELAAPVFPKGPEGHVESLPDGEPCASGSTRV